jgi:hypothetical protein
MRELKMQIDLDRWHRLLAAAADAELDGPAFIDVQTANTCRARARDQLARFKAAGPQGRASGPPMARAHAGEEIMPGIGGHGPDDIARAFKTSVAELEAREAEAEREAARLADRLHECAERRNALHRNVEDVRRWAAQQSPPVVLPGDEPGMPPVVTVQGPPPGTHDFLGRPV